MWPNKTASTWRGGAESAPVSPPTKEALQKAKQWVTLNKQSHSRKQQGG